MSLGNTAFMVGPIGAILVIPLAVVAVVVGVLRRPRWAVRAIVARQAGAGVAWLAYWVLWYRAFDYADAGKPVPAPIEAASNATMVLCAGGIVLLTTAAGALAVSRRRQIEHR